MLRTHLHYHVIGGWSCVRPSFWWPNSGFFWHFPNAAEALCKGPLRKFRTLLGDSAEVRRLDKWDCIELGVFALEVGLQFGFLRSSDSRIHSLGIGCLPVRESHVLKVAPDISRDSLHLVLGRSKSTRILKPCDDIAPSPSICRSFSMI